MQSVTKLYEIISLKAAKARGLPRFFHGRACKYGHVAQRSVHTGGCCECLRLLQNTEAWKARRRAQYSAVETVRRDRKERNLRRNYGMTISQVNAMALEQNFCCAICEHRSDLAGKRLVVDHDHATGKVRSLLCDDCNRGLGSFNDNRKRLESAISYLRKHMA